MVNQAVKNRPVKCILNIFTLFNSSWCPTLYVVYLTMPRRPFYPQKIGWLLWFWWKIGLERTKYSISHTFSGESPLIPPANEEGPLLW